MECTSCPFYEDHGGEYYQGCWEFYNICWAAQDLGTFPNCYNSCFMLQENEEEMLNVCLGALDKKREIKCHDGSSIERDLTALEKSYIIKDMETFMKIFNEIKDPTSYYK